MLAPAYPKVELGNAGSCRKLPVRYAGIVDIEASGVPSWLLDIHGSSQVCQGGAWTFMQCWLLDLYGLSQVCESWLLDICARLAPEQPILLVC